MRVESLEVFSDASNMAVVRTTGRKFPGVVIQGDSLNGLWDLAKRVCVLIEALPRSDSREAQEALEWAQELKDLLGARVHHYVKILREHDTDLPFPYEDDHEP